VYAHGDSARLWATRDVRELQVGSRDLVDECEVLMWVKGVGAGFRTEEPCIPVRSAYERGAGMQYSG
jgi:hypothetical protein